jgi:hypothetical protein
VHRIVEELEPGKGGKQHRYLQSLVKEFAEQNGLKATIEAPIGNGGQVDVLIERDGVLAAIEISVTTLGPYEREKLRKYLDMGYPRVALVLAKSRGGRKRDALLEDISDKERERVSVLSPEEIPDYIASLAPPPEPSETIVKGYRVRLSHTTASPEEAKSRRDALARVIVRSMNQRE